MARIFRVKLERVVERVTFIAAADAEEARRKVKKWRTEEQIKEVKEMPDDD